MELRPHLRDAALRQGVLVGHVLRAFAGHQVQRDAAVAVGVGGQPLGKIHAEGDLLVHGRDRVVGQGVLQWVAAQRAVVRQRLHREAAPLLGQRRQHVLALLLAAQPSAAPDGPGGVGGDGGGELRDVLASLREADVPLPAEGDHLGDELFLLAGVLDVPEVDAAVPLDAGQDHEEGDVRRVRGGVGACVMGTISRGGPSPAGGGPVTGNQTAPTKWRGGNDGMRAPASACIGCEGKTGSVERSHPFWAGEGIIYENVQPAETLINLMGERFDRLGVADVHLHAMEIESLRLHLLGVFCVAFQNREAVITVAPA